MTSISETWQRAKMTQAEFYDRLGKNAAATSVRCGHKIEVYISGDLVSVYYLPQEVLAWDPAEPKEKERAYAPPPFVLPDFEKTPEPVLRTPIDFKATAPAPAAEPEPSTMTRQAGPLGEPICAKCGRVMQLNMGGAMGNLFWSCIGFVSGACDGTRPFAPRPEDTEEAAGDYGLAQNLSLKHYLGLEFDLGASEMEIEHRRRVRRYKVTDRTLAAMSLIACTNVDRAKFIERFWPNSAGSSAYVTQLCTRGLVIDAGDRLRLSTAGEKVLEKAMQEGKL